MNYIRHLHAFYYHVKRDNRLTASHISLYLAIFQYWNYNRFQNPFRIIREELMSLSKIGSKNTYHKCIKELHQAGYIHYNPPLSKFQPVKISVVRLDPQDDEKNTKQLDLFSTKPEASFDTKPINSLVFSNAISKKVVPHHSIKIETNAGTKIDTTPVPDLISDSTEFDTATVSNVGHLLKHKQLNCKPCVFKTGKITPTIIFEKNKDLANAVSKLGELNESPARQKLAACRRPALAIAPQKEITSPGPFQVSLSTVEVFFRDNNFPGTEAQKFFYYNQGRGWMLTETMPVKDWQALAYKWMLNNAKVKINPNEKSGSNQKQDIHPGPGKDYSEPL